MTILRKLDFPRAAFEGEMGAYSAGQKKKVLLAASLCRSAHLYVWDEPLNFVDLFSRIQMEELLLEYRPTPAVRGARRGVPGAGGHPAGVPA